MRDEPIRSKCGIKRSSNSLCLGHAGQRTGGNLTYRQIDYRSRMIRVFGKGRKERLVPFSETAKIAMDYYFKNQRDSLLAHRKNPVRSMLSLSRIMAGN
jgi:hypothetical protein